MGEVVAAGLVSMANVASVARVPEQSMACAVLHRCLSKVLRKDSLFRSGHLIPVVLKQING